MGWFCSEIMAQPSPRLLTALRELPGIERAVYFVRSVPGRRPNFPKAGLVFVRTVGDVWGDMLPGVPWPELPAGEDLALSIPADLPRLRTMDGEEVLLGIPERFLKLLKWLSRDTGSVVAYYAAHSWGGPFEWECAWVFQPREVAYCMLYGERRVRVYREGAAPAEEDGDVLVRTLGHLGVESPVWEFAPHDSRFEWEPHRVG
jgi:hypothetical protein